MDDENRTAPRGDLYAPLGLTLYVQDWLAIIAFLDYAALRLKSDANADDAFVARDFADTLHDRVQKARAIMREFSMSALRDLGPANDAGPREDVCGCPECQTIGPALTRH